MGVPSRLALDALALEGLIAAENILEGTGHDMVDPRFAIGGGRAFKEYESAVVGTCVHTAAEHIALLPLLHHLLGNAGQIKGASFRKTSGHRVGTKDSARKASRIGRAKITRRPTESTSKLG